MRKKKTHDEYVLEVSQVNSDVEVVGQYIDAKTPIKHYCKRHNLLWDVCPQSILNGSGCPECGKEKISNKKGKTHEQYVSEVSNINPNIEVIEKYIGANIPIKHLCKEHNIIWNAYPTNILRGHGCPYCAGNIKKSHDQYVYEVSKINPFIEVVEQYINARTPIMHRCKIDGHEWSVAPYVILRGDGCPKCAGNAKKTHDEYVKEVSIVNSNIEVIGQYINANTPILHRCKIDGYIWYATPANILFGCGCPECKKRILSNIFKKSHKQYVEEVASINSDIEVLEQYINSHTPILHRCKQDGYMWKIAPSNVLSGQGCPCCQESQGERQIRQWLEKNNIAYIYQNPFDDCRDKKILPFDFYLPEHNICIEFDGRQHFEPVDFAGKGNEWAEEQFIKTKKHDEIKTKYCKDNNIHLLRIPYFKNVEEELNNFYLFNTVTLMAI